MHSRYSRTKVPLQSLSTEAKDSRCRAVMDQVYAKAQLHQVDRLPQGHRQGALSMYLGVLRASWCTTQKVCEVRRVQHTWQVLARSVSRLLGTCGQR